MRKSLSTPGGLSVNHFAKIILLPILVFLWGNVWGQVSTTYTFSQSSGTYTAITGGTQFVTTTSGVTSYDTGGNYQILPITSRFTFNNLSVTTVNMTDDGALILNPTSSTTGNNITTPISNSLVADGIISGLGMDLRSTTISGQVYEKRWEDTGTELVFQWQNAARFNQQASERFSFQIRIVKSSGVIKVVYGNMTTITATTNYIPQVGLRGSTNSDYNARRLTTTIPDGSPSWDDTTVATSNSHNVRFTATSPAAIPTSGHTFIWTPASCSSLPAGLTTSNVLTNSATISWTAASSAPANGYEYHYSTNSTTPLASQTPSGTTTAGTITANISSLNTATQYYFWVRSNCDGTNKSAWSSVGTFVTACSLPSEPASLSFGTTAATTQVVNWTAPTTIPTGYVVFRSNSATPPVLVNGIVYTASTGGTLIASLTNGSNTYHCIYNGTGNTVTASGLTANTRYYYYAFSRNGTNGTAPDCNGAPWYSTSNAAGDKATCVAVPTTLTYNGFNATASTANVSWTASATGGGVPVTYNLEVATDNAFANPIAGSPFTGITATNYTIGGLTAYTTYYYRVTSVNGSCGVTSAVANFYTGYCTPTNTGSATYINNFSTTLGHTTNITNNASGYTTGGYQDNYSTMSVNSYNTGSINYSYTLVGGSAHTGIWVDWNKNFLFEDSERIFFTTSQQASGTYTGTITIPTGTAIGDYRLRIKTDFSGTSPNPCTSTGTRMETEDYKLSVVAQPDYVVYTDATTANATVNNAIDIYFKDFDGVSNFYTDLQESVWMYAWGHASGQNINDKNTLIQFNKVSSNPNLYKATVKFADLFCINTGVNVAGIDMLFLNQYGPGDNNQTGNMYLPLTPATVTLNAPILTATTNIASNSATINWTAPTSGTIKGYEYYYSTNGATPGATPTPIASTAVGVQTANLSSLSPSTQYYVWVRTKGCGTEVSDWSTVGTFTTLCNPTPITVVEGFNSTTLPTCWSTKIVGTTQTSTKISLVTTTANSSSAVNTPSEGSHMILYDAYNNTNGGSGSEERLISLPISSLGSAGVDIEFDWRKENQSSWNSNNDYMQVEYSTDGGVTWTNAGVQNNRVDTTVPVGTAVWERKIISVPALANQSQFLVAFKFRSAYGYNMYIDGVKITPTVPKLYVNNTQSHTVTFPAQVALTQSTSQNFSLTGTTLSSAPGNITVSSPSTDFELSNDNTTWSSSTTISYSSATLAATPVYVRYTPQTSCTSPSVALNISGGGVTVAPVVTLNGTSLVPAPTATAATTITDTSFTAHWDAVPGATGYELDVYKKEVRPNATDLFISEYTEGSSNNKYIEIYNGTGADLNLSDYRLRLFSNGSSTADVDNQLSGVLANNSTKVYKNSSAVLPLPSGITAENNSAIAFNGDDAIALYKISSSSYVDIFGRIGNDPGTAWTGAGGYTTLDKTLIRKSSVLNGVSVSPTGTGATAFTTLTTEWNMSNIDTVSDLGIHSFDGGTIFTYILQNENVANVTSYNVTGLTPDTQYHYVVRAITTTCESANSSEKDVKTDNTVVWNAGAWSNTSGPSATLNAVVRAPFVVGADATQTAFTAKDLTVESTGSLEILANQGITVAGKITTADNKIIIDSDGSLLQTNSPTVNDNIGQIIAKRGTHMRKMDYTYWATPVTGQKLLNTSGGANSTLYNVGGFSEGTPNNRIYQYNEPNDTFKAATDANFVPAKAYAVRGKDRYLIDFPSNVPVADQFTFTGIANNGTYSVGIQKSKNTTSGTPAVEYTHGYNMIGNPYPSNIDFIKFFNFDHGDGTKNSNHIWGKAWFWTNVPGAPTSQGGSAYTPNNYAILSLAGGTPATGVDTDETESPTSDIPNEFIKVAQGFIVEMKGTAPTGATPNTAILKFDNSIRTNNSTGHFYNSKNSQNEINRYWLKLTSPFNIVNTILVAHMDGATNGYDADYDAELLAVGDDSFYSKLNTQKLQIQAKNNPLSAEDVIPLGTKYSTNGTYKISLGKREGVFEDNQKIYLFDKVNNSYTDLTSQDYIFAATKGLDETRFQIVYKSSDVLSSNDLSKSDFTVHRDGEYFVIRSTSKLGKIELYDVSGRLVIATSSAQKEFRLDAATIPSGVFVIRAENSGNIRTKKIIK